jgi:hypothetical protein
MAQCLRSRKNALGNPQSRGLPTWFIVPKRHVKQILDIYCDQEWRPTLEEKVRLAAELKKAWDLYRADSAR